jgi:hypothetical protein
MNSLVTSTTGLRAYRQTIVACFVFRQEISRRAVWDFFDSIGQTRTLLLGAARPLPPTADVPSRTSGTAMGASTGLMHRSKSAALFDNLVGAAEQRRWKNQAKSLGGAQVDDQFDFHCLLDRRAAGLGAKTSHSTDYRFLLHDD